MQRFKMFYWLILGLVVNPIQANQYQAAMDQSLWLVSSHLLSCHISQEIPGFGHAYFKQPAGDRYSFTWTVTSMPCHRVRHHCDR